MKLQRKRKQTRADQKWLLRSGNFFTKSESSGSTNTKVHKEAELMEEMHVCMKPSLNDVNNKEITSNYEDVISQREIDSSPPLHSLFYRRKQGMVTRSQDKATILRQRSQTSLALILALLLFTSIKLDVCESRRRSRRNMTLQEPPILGSPSVESNLWSQRSNETLISLDGHIKSILKPRVSGTPGIVVVRNYISTALKNLNYLVELDEFTDSTPNGPVKFANIIATSNPKACRQLALACHYDSKLQEGFLGAIDSAVPCAMLLQLAQTFSESFRQQDLGLMFIFFDGEEAVREWTATDSLYGSRHLAAKWERQQVALEIPCKGRSELSRLELLVVLDLIGSTDTTFTMYSRRLRHHYSSLQRYEQNHLISLGLPVGRHFSAFKSNYVPLEFMQDDHVPFMKRGVPILSLLAYPFPEVWHTNDDNYSAIDFARTMRILHALEQFVKNYTTL